MAVTFPAESRLPRRGSGRAASVALAALLAGLPASAAELGPGHGDNSLSANDVVDRVNARPEGVSLTQTLIMELVDRRGRKRLRETRTFRKYYGEEKRTLISFESPKNVKGTAFLTYDYPEAERDDDQWLYLPALRKVRRVSSADRGDYFLGTDFTYEDVKKGGKFEVADYHFELVSYEEVEGHPCTVLDAVPVSESVAKELGYGRARAWIDSEIWTARKFEMWDVHGNPLKSVERSDFRLIQGIWTPHVVEALNHKTGHRSTFTFRDTIYDEELADGLFTERALRRGR